MRRQKMSADALFEDLVCMLSCRKNSQNGKLENCKRSWAVLKREQILHRPFAKVWRRSWRNRNQRQAHSRQKWPNTSPPCQRRTSRLITWRTTLIIAASSAEILSKLTEFCKETMSNSKKRLSSYRTNWTCWAGSPLLKLDSSIPCETFMNGSSHKKTLKSMCSRTRSRTFRRRMKCWDYS